MYERTYALATTIVFLSLAYFSYQDGLHFIHFPAKENFIFFRTE
jgi:hypothetical protein